MVSVHIFESARVLLTGDQSDPTEKLERIILDHMPGSAGEAASILELAASEMELGRRSDGRDVGAIRRVSSWLRSQ